jgi:hypothetical protein
MSKKETPTAVRVARWTAVAAAITALGTIGNTFIEKRPWFLGGEDEKPAIVASVPKSHPKMEHYESPVIHFNIPKGTEYIQKSVSEESVAASVMSTSSSDATMTQAAMAGTPDMGLYRNTLNFMIYRPVAFWLIVATSILILIYLFIEYIYIAKRKPLYPSRGNINCVGHVV